MRFGRLNIILIAMILISLASMESPTSQLFALRLPPYQRHGPVCQRCTFRQVLAYGRP